MDSRNKRVPVGESSSTQRIRYLSPWLWALALLMVTGAALATGSARPDSLVLPAVTPVVGCVGHAPQPPSPCEEYYCNKPDRAWDTRPLPRGTACNDGNSCTLSDACDSNGSCIGTPIVCIFNPPGAITGSPSSTTGNITLTWSAPSAAVPIARYELYQNGAPAGSFPGTQLTATLSRSDGSFAFKVRACDSVGCGPFTSPDFVVTVLRTPAAPTISGPAQSLTGIYTITGASPGV